jgi:hypothetical protein
MSVKKKARGDALSTDPPWLGLAVPAARQTQASPPRYRGALQPPGERCPTRGAQDPSTRYGLTAGRAPPKRVARPCSRKLGPPTKQPFGGGPFSRVAHQRVAVEPRRRYTTFTTIILRINLCVCLERLARQAS